MVEASERLEKKDFADKCIAYNSLLKEIDAQEKTSYLKRELSLYLLFMFVFVIWVTSFSNVNDAYQFERVVYSTVVEKEFPESPDPDNVNYVSFYNIATETTYFQWVREVVWDELFFPAANGTGSTTGEVLDWNQLLWGLRFRQLRVAPNSGCTVPDKIRNSGIPATTCAGPYSVTTRSTVEFGPIVNPNATTSAREFVWQDADLTSASPYEGELATYDGSGFVVDFLLNATDAVDFVDAVNDLERNYVDEFTRAVFLEFTLYNVNFNLFMFCNFIVEFGPSGTLVPTHVCRAAPLIPGDNSNPGMLATLCNVVLCILTLVYLYRFVVKELRFLRRIQPFWMLIDLVSIVLLMFHLLFVIRVQLFGEGQELLATALAESKYYSTDSATKVYHDLYGYYAVNMVLICVRIFKFLKLSSGLAMVWKTISRAVKDLLYFTGLFVIVFLGFVLCGFLVFGPHLRDYATVGYSSSTLLRMVVGEVDYAPLRRINPQFAWVFFASYVILFFFVLVNIFLAIILDAWHAEADAERRQGGGVDLVDEFKTELVQWWERFRKNYNKPRYWRGAFRMLRDRMLNRNTKRDFLGDEMVLGRLQEWKRKRANRAKKFVSISDLQQALEGVPKEMEVREAQLVDIFFRAKRHLIPIDAASTADDDDEEGEDESQDDMNISELKKLQASFSLLAENQRRHLDSIGEKIDGLGSIQSQTTSKVDYLDEQVRKIVPHFAE